MFYKQECLNDIKVGEKIIYRIGGFYNRRFVVATVIKVSAKQFEDSEGNKFRKEDGKMICYSEYCRRATEEDVAVYKALRHRNAVYTNVTSIINEKLSDFSTEDLEKIYEIAKKYK